MRRDTRQRDPKCWILDLGSWFKEYPPLYNPSIPEWDGDWDSIDKGNRTNGSKETGVVPPSVPSSFFHSLLSIQIRPSPDHNWTWAHAMLKGNQKWSTYTYTLEVSMRRSHRRIEPNRRLRRNKTKFLLEFTKKKPGFQIFWIQSPPPKIMKDSKMRKCEEWWWWW